MRRVALVHKTSGTCPTGVAHGPAGSRILSGSQVPRPNEAVDYFDKCPVCGKECHEEEQAQTCQD